MDRRPRSPVAGRRSPENAPRGSERSERPAAVREAIRPRPIAEHELCEGIWQGTVVGESNLAGLKNELRTALGDGVRIEGATPLREGQTVVLGDASLVFRTSALHGSTISIGR